MADPVTLAMVGAAAGAALKPKDPLKGAMLGATAGFTGGTALGIGAAGTAAAGGTGLAAGTGAANAAALGAETTGLGTGIGTGTAMGLEGASGLTAIPTTVGSASNVSAVANAANAAQAASPSLTTAPEWFGLDAVSKTPIGLNAPAATEGYSLLAPSAATPSAFTPTFMERLGMAGQSAYENPMMTAQALNATQGLLDPGQQSPSAPAVPVQARKQLSNYDPMAAMNPYKQSVVGGQPISLI